MANRNFNAKQALEHEIKDLYAEIAPAVLATEATATLNTTVDIVLTSAVAGADENGNTFELVVNAPAANPTDTVLAVFTGTAAAIVCTITPNDGTNNLAGPGDPVPLTELELAELINSGVVVGKTVTLTDAGSLRNNQTAVGGDTSDLTAADDQEVTFADGADEVAPSLVSGVGFASVAHTDTGEYTLTLQDAYNSLRSADAILKWGTVADINFQITAQTVATTKTIVVTAKTAATAVDLDDAARIMFKAELKNSSVRD